MQVAIASNEDWSSDAGNVRDERKTSVILFREITTEPITRKAMEQRKLFLDLRFSLRMNLTRNQLAIESRQSASDATRKAIPKSCISVLVGLGIDAAWVKFLRLCSIS